MIKNAMMNASRCRHQSDRPENGVSSKRAIAGSPIQPRASEASVIPNWHAERYALRFCSSPMTRFAERLPEATRVSMREARTPTKANSAATKNPFAATSRKTERSFRMVELVGGNHNASQTDAQKVHDGLSTIYALFVCFCGLVSGGRPGCASP